MSPRYVRCIVAEVSAQASDVSRRTWLAAERTWLAWWRSGVAVGAIAIGVGRFLPAVSGGARWPFRLLGVGYGVLSVATLVIGAARQRQASEALRSGSYEELTSPLVSWMTAAGMILAVGATALVVTAL